MKPLVFSLFAVLLIAGAVTAQPVAEPAPGGGAREARPSGEKAAPDPAALHYVVKDQAPVYYEPNTSMPFRKVTLREEVQVLGEKNGWVHIRKADGAEGYVRKDVLSNVWLRVSKSSNTLYIYRGPELVKKMPADFGYNVVGDKERQGTRSAPEHWRTPEGVFYVCRRNPNSEFYKALVLNYPTPEHAARGLRQGLITRSQHDDIVRAAETFSVPPMNTALGGMIEIHGWGTGGRNNWTKGCVALRDVHMDDLWAVVHVGTPVVIEP